MRKLHLTSTSVLTSLGAMLAFALPGAVHAQNAEPAPAEADAGAGEIIVTAQKRAESVNDVPLSIQAFSGDTLASAGVSDASGLAQVSPGLNFAKSSANTPIFTIRGVGFNTPNLSSTSPVGIYVDEVAYAYPYMGAGPSFDMERVEILKGPQGTLYGRNTTGGLINFITAKPGKDFEGGLQAELGNYQTYNIEAFLNVPVTETLGIRFAGRWENSDKGWQKSVSRDDRLGEKDRRAARLTILWEPTDRITVDLGASYWADKSDTVATQATMIATDRPASLVPGIAGAVRTDWDNDEADWEPDAPGKPAFRSDSRFYGLRGRVDVDLSDSLTFVSLTGYNDLRRRDFNDLDGTPFEAIAYLSAGRIKSFSQELRLVGEAGRLNYILGGYYSRDKIDDNQVGYVADGSTFRFLRGVAQLADPANVRFTAAEKAAGFARFATTTDQTSRSASIFGNADYELSDTLKLSAGLRYTEDKLSFSACSRDFNGNTRPVWNTAVPLAIFLRTGQRPFTDIGVNQCLTYNSAFTAPASFERPPLKEDNVAGRLSLAWQPDSDTLVYGTVSRGYKSGAVPVLPANNETQLDPARQEKVTAFELGTKLTLADRVLQVNAATFFYKYDDKQLFGEVPDVVFTTLTRIINIPKSEIYGAEADITLRATDALQFRLGASYTHTEITRYNGFDRNGLATDFSGAAFPYTPKWQLSGMVHYDAPISAKLGLRATVNASHQSKTSSAIGNEAGFEIKAYTLVNANLAVYSLNDRLSVGLFARNLFNANYWTASDTVIDTIFRVPGMPRTYGVTLGTKF